MGTPARLLLLASSLGVSDSRAAFQQFTHSRHVFKSPQLEGIDQFGLGKVGGQGDWGVRFIHSMTNTSNFFLRTAERIRQDIVHKITRSETFQPHVVVFMVGLPAVCSSSHTSHLHLYRSPFSLSLLSGGKITPDRPTLSQSKHRVACLGLGRGDGPPSNV